MAERFFLNLKMERVWQRQHANHAEAKADIVDYIVGFDNCKRIKSALGNLSPAAYERETDRILGPKVSMESKRIKMAVREHIVVSEISWPPQGALPHRLTHGLDVISELLSQHGVDDEDAHYFMFRCHRFEWLRRFTTVRRREGPRRES
ncbi:IS3 family transposase [Rugamonas apoptosis]|uniref:IS3 family transposase n=1 Tax=Rugamonas apoptosis TaxID=2758570 RepID=A0A7W2IMU0_9BURK|nr:IS3 family transposase [Rugamonas apoptosis]